MNNEGRQVNCIQIKKELELHIERRTTNNCFLKHGYKYKNHAQKFMLSKKQKIRRVGVVAQ